MTTTDYRAAKRRIPTKAELAARIVARRAGLATRTIADLSMVHLVNLDAIADGQADVEILQQTIGGVFTWQRVAERIGRGGQEMQAQHDLMMNVWARYVRTSTIMFAGYEYELAKTGTVVMDMLAELVDRPTAVAAAEWGQRRLQRFVNLVAVSA